MDQLVNPNILERTPGSRSQFPDYVVEVIPGDRGWILERLANEISAAAKASDLAISACILDEPTGDADLTYFLPYAKQQKVKGSVVGSWFTHQEEVEPAKTRFIEAAKAADFCLCPARRYWEVLRAHGVEDVNVIHHGVDLDTYVPKLRIGIVGRTYHTGRKGEHLLAPAMALDNVEFLFHGSGWPGTPADQDLAEFYRSIDYLLIPALIEGGPVPLFEALASGCQVIASDVGCVDEFPHISFKKGSAGDLKRVIAALRNEKFELRGSVEGLTWDSFGQAHIECFVEQIENRKPANRRKRLNDGARKADISVSHLAIVSHGTESTSRGGPTTRIAEIDAHFTAKGGHCTVAPTVDAAISQMEHAPQIAHIFNSWPITSATAEISSARASGIPIVYSPIALNLSTRAFFEGVIPDALETCTTEHQLKYTIEHVRSRTSEWSATAAPAEGADMHYEHLARGVSQSDCVIFLSEYERTFLAALNIMPRRSRLIRNGVETEIFSKACPDLFKDRYGLSDFLLIVGRIEGRKNQALAALALKELNVPLVCIGHAGNQKYLQQVRKWAGDSFVHIDRIEDRQVLSSAYKGAKALILTSWAEGAPLAALEAGAAGTPLFLSTLSSEQEHFGEFAKYFHPADLEGLKGAIEAELEKPETPDRRAQRSDFCVSRYDIKRHVSETVSLYEQIARDRPARTRTVGDVIDITHLAHSLHNGLHQTGVTALESSIVEQMLTAAPDTKCVLWNSPLRAYLQVPPTMMNDQTFPDLANSRHVPEQIVSSFPRTSFSAMPSTDGPLGVSPPALVPSVRNMSAGLICRTLLKYGVFALSGKPQTAAIKAVKLFWPSFKSEILPQHDFLKRTHKNPGMTAVSSVGAARDAAFSAITYDSAPTRFPRVSGDRLFLFGQPWISNDRQLTDLVNFVETNDLNLHVLIHDVLYITDVNAFPTAARRDYRRRLITLLRVAHTLLVTSRHVFGAVKHLIKSERLSCHVRLINVGVPSSRALAETPKCSGRITELCSAGPPIVYVSSINNRKNHTFLIEVWRELRKRMSGHALEDLPKLALIGTPQHEFEYLEDPAEQKRLAADGIVLAKGLGDHEVSSLYQRCLFTVYPSRSEGWGFPPLESLAAGKICIASNTVPSVQETDCSALIKLCPNDFYGWVETLQAFIQNPKMRESFENETAELEFPSWSDLAQELLMGDAGPSSKRPV